MSTEDFAYLEEIGPQHISPRFTTEKASPGTLSDWIDVWEDRIQGLWLDHVLALRGQANASNLVTHVAVGLIEALEIAYQGKSSDGASAQFFGSGFVRMFSAEASSPISAGAAASILYKAVRCGLTHAAMLYGSVLLVGHDRAPPVQLFVTPDGTHVAAVMINPAKFLGVVALQFREYVKLLRTGTGPEADERRARFADAWHLLHAVNLPSPVPATVAQRP